MLVPESPHYAVAAVLLSVASLALLLTALPRASRAYHVYHDDRAAVSLALVCIGIVIALGLLVSALGVATHTGWASVVGVSVSRGAVLVMAVILLLDEIRGRRK
jgi:uncharacterized membrane protein